MMDNQNGQFAQPQGQILPEDPIITLRKLKADMEVINASKKDLQTKINEINNKAVPKLIEMNKRFIASEASGPGTGPFYILSKNTVEGTMSEEKSVIFFRLMLEEQKREFPKYAVYQQKMEEMKQHPGFLALDQARQMEELQNHYHQQKFKFDSPQSCAKTMKEFLKLYQKRTIVLKEVTQLHERDGVDRLLHWQKTGEEIG